MTNRVGQQLGKYRLIRELGRGGFAAVYLGEHLHLKTQAAVKMLDGNLVTPDTQAFTKEAQTIAALKHPHILRVLDFDFDETTPFLIMEYASEGTLRDRHPRGSLLPPLTVISYVKPIAAALQYAHDAKVIHRDVKPENILVDDRQTLLLSDFGIAALAHSTVSLQTLDSRGTPHYMAPEQFQNHPRPASDQYGLAIMVYEWLCGQRPFHGDTFFAIGMQHLSTPVPSLIEKNESITPALEQVIFKALAKDPKQRFESVQAFASALEQVCQLTWASPSDLPSAVTSSNPFSQPTNVQIPTSQASQATSSVPSPTPSILLPHLSKQRISRRTVALGVGLAGLTVAGGSFAWLTSLHGQTVSFEPRQTPTPSPTPLPLGTTLYTYHGHSSEVTAVRWSPDGKRIASGSYDSTVQVWDATDGGHAFTFCGHPHEVFDVAWSPNGQHIASSGGYLDYMVHVWDADNGGHIYTYRGHSKNVYTAAWSPNGKRIASSSWDATVQVWDAVDGGNPYTYRGHSGQVSAATWSPNGQRLVSAGTEDNTVQVWDAIDGGNAYSYTAQQEPISVGLPLRGHWSTRKPKLMGHLYQYGTQCLIVDDAHDLSLEHLMLIKEVTDQGHLQYGHPLGLCLVAAGRGATIPLKETLDLPDPTWLQFRRRLDKLQPFCRIAGHTSEEVRDILATLETVFQHLFPQLNLRQWGSSIYAWLTHPVLDPTHSGRVTMDNLMRLVMTVLEWTYEAGEMDVRAERLKSAAELLVLHHDTLQIIDGAGPDVPVDDQDRDPKDGANGNEPERQTVQENEQQNPTETVETEKEQEQTSTSPNCTFSKMVIAIDPKRFADRNVAVVECPDCSRTRSLSTVKGVLRFPPHKPRKIQTPVISQRWAMCETIWEVVGREL